MSNVPYLIIAPFLALTLHLPKPPAQILYLKNLSGQSGEGSPFRPDRTFLSRACRAAFTFRIKKGRSKDLPFLSKFQMELFLPALPVPMPMSIPMAASLRRH